MLQNIIYGTHTADYKHQIAKSEAEYIKNSFEYDNTKSIKGCMKLYQEGIDEFTIHEYTPPRQRTKYELILKINHQRLLGGNGNLLMELSKSNVQKVVKCVNNILKTVFKLDGQFGNNDFNKWNIERFDDAFDLYLDDDPRGYVYLMNQSLYLPPRNKFKVYDYMNLYPFSPRASESVYFGNKSYTINAYSKEHEVLRKNSRLLGDIETHNLLRIERQSNQQYLSNFLPKRIVAELNNDRNISNMRQSLKKQIKIFWGSDDYYEKNYVLELATEKRIKRDDTYSILLNDEVMSGGRLKTHKNLDKTIRDTYKKLGIATAYVDFSIRGKCGYFTDDGGDTKYYSFPSICGMINDIFPDEVKRRRYHSFAVPHFDKKRGDFRVSLTIHIQPSRKGIPDSACGLTFDLCQERIFKKLAHYYSQNKNNNLSNDGIMVDFRNFYKTVESKELKRIINKFLERNGEIICKN